MTRNLSLCTYKMSARQKQAPKDQYRATVLMLGIPVRTAYLYVVSPDAQPPQPRSNSLSPGGGGKENRPCVSIASKQKMYSWCVYVLGSKPRDSPPEASTLSLSYIWNSWITVIHLFIHSSIHSMVTWESILNIDSKLNSRVIYTELNKVPALIIGIQMNKWINECIRGSHCCWW